MARIVVIGGGLIGLATALMTARQGHQVTVLERDPAPPPPAPGAAWDRWERHGVMQFRQPHFLPRAARHRARRPGNVKLMSRVLSLLFRD